MSGRLTIIMYHYVHEPAGQGFVKLVGRTYDEFQGQLDYLERHFAIITPEQFTDAVNGSSTLPANACMLTFDDGYRIHYSVVFKALRERGLCGFFFPPARPVAEPNVLDVHKIHFTLTSPVGPSEVARQLCGWLEANAATFSLQPVASYKAAYAKASRFDPAEIVFVKRVLQKGLPDVARAAAVDWLFRKLSGHDEAALSNAFYLRAHEITEMVDNGMYVGSHSYSHRWLDTLTGDEQDRELDLSLAFLESVGAPTGNWIMCYPYGGQNPALLDRLRRRGCVAGLTTEVAVADVGRHDPLLLPRLDTNDLPLRADG
ncbi:polysaccharide deacetylase family protein [Reyranella sp. CPCC 100927]|uniref:polysaccharide deacetylase family protein n=1 Tax=Reyranella sp. CPCC 100927 TaxID=2599616 RepID=UPI0011B6BF45|nr:polysaccharide deacetylase family protein [Reyranella sp. CPCC 100927]TWT08807.1 polysaccharide deacetylase family protein [Reyranella sp. CPCC 100927]